jgi:hypothetical protein
MLKEGFPQIMEHRYGMYLVKFPSYIFLLLGASIKTSIIVYSASFYFLYGLIFFLLHRIARNEVFAMLVVMYLTVMMAQDFYWCASEQITGYAFVLLVFGFVNPKRMERYWWLLGLTILIPFNFFHPLLLLPTALLCGYLILEHGQLKNWKYYSLIGFLIAGVFIKRFFFTDAYDSERISNFQQTIETYQARFWEIPSFVGFFKLAWHHYYLFYFLLAIGVFLLLRTKSYLKLSVWILGMLLHLVIVSFNEHGIYVRYYSEANFLVFGIYLALPLLFYFVRREKYDLLRYILLIVFGLSLVKIYNSHKPFTERVNYLQQLVNQAESGKSYISWEEVDQRILIMEWAVPFESALLSADGTSEVKSTIYVSKELEDDKDAFHASDLFLNVFSHYIISEMYPRWINLPEGSYERISLSQY